MQSRPCCFWCLIPLACLMLSCSGGDRFEREAALEEVSVNLARQADRYGYSLVTTDELAKMLQQGMAILLVDARTAESFRKGHIPAAESFTFPKGIVMNQSWNSALMGSRTPEQFRALLGEDMDRMLVFSCGRTRCDRGHNAALWAVKLGYRNVFRHPGGIEAWQGKGRQIVGSHSS
ncbi:MAG: rhodanese-like domain-containing protein [Endozoicomonas sp.]